MKIHRINLAYALAFALMPFTGLSTKAQSDLIINTFASGSETNHWYNHWGVPGPFGWDSAADASGQTNSGSLVITNAFAAATDWQQCATTHDLTNFVDTTAYANFSVDVRALGGPEPNGWLWYCNLRLAVLDTNWTYIELGEVQIVGTNWSHVEMPLRLPPTNKLVRAVTVVAAGSGLAGPVILWVDNVKLTAATQPPPALAIQPASSGVELYASAPAYTNQGVWQRQEIRTVGGGYSWVGRSQPVSYSVSVAQFPYTTHDGFGLYMHLVGNAANPSANADWNEANVIYFRVVSTESGYFMQVVSKVNAPNSSVWNSPLLVGHSDTNGPSGTFGVTLHDTFQGTFVVIAWPGGQSALTQLPSGTGNYFNSSAHVFIGITPGKVNNIGQSATIQRVQVTGAATSLDDHFSDLNNWLNLAQDPAGVVLHPTTTIAKLSWLPPAGVWRLKQSPDLTTGSWIDSPLPVVAVGARKLAFVSATPSVDEQFYRLKNP